MVDFSTASTEAEFIESVRGILLAYVPESDAWVQPNFYSILATVNGGLSWTAINEARNGIDLRVNAQTAVDEYLDSIAAQPEYGLERYGPTQAIGTVVISFPLLSSVPAGYVFTSSTGQTYQAAAFTALAAGTGTVPVVSVGRGIAQNALNNRPLSAPDGKVISLGIFGGQDDETDDQLRARMFGERSKRVFFGSSCSYENVMLGIPGVSRVWANVDAFSSKIMFLMEDKYPCGAPLQADIEAVKALFKDECLTNMCSCLNIEGATSLSVSPEITWAVCPDDICEIEVAMRDWLRVNFDISEGVKVCDIQNFLDQQFPELGGEIDCCVDYPPVPCAVYNCAELVG